MRVSWALGLLQCRHSVVVDVVVVVAVVAARRRLRRVVGGSGGVPADVQGEVVGAGEGSRALAARERADSGVLAIVSSQLVRPREPPPATRPLTRVRLLAYK